MTAGLVCTACAVEPPAPGGDGRCRPCIDSGHTAWHYDRDLGSLLDAAERFIGRFVVFANRYQRVAVVLWLAHVFGIQAAAAAAYLRIKSAAEESGKTTLLEVLELLLGALGVNGFTISPSVAYRLRDKVGPVALLLDEVDHTLKARQDDSARDLLALVNAGYRRSATAYRSEARTFEPRAFRAFGPAAIAGIGNLHPTTESRCIPIVLERKLRGEGDRWLRHLVEEDGQRIRERFEAWATPETIDRLRAMTPTFPEELRDRHVEVWWLLWCIADMAGGEWPKLAREAATSLHLDGQEADTMTTGVLLLAHVREAFEEANADRLSTEGLLDKLVENEEGPWGKWWGSEVSHEETPRAAAVDLARHLRAFAVRPKDKKSNVIKFPDGTTARGYMREWFEDSWARYLPPRNQRNHRNPTASEVTSVTSVTPPHGPETNGEEKLDAVQTLLENQFGARREA